MNVSSIRMIQTSKIGDLPPARMNPLSRLLVAVLALVPLTALADGPTAAATISDTSVQVGETVEYRINIIGADGGKQPQAPQVDGLSVTGSHRSDLRQFTGSFFFFIYTVTT